MSAVRAESMDYFDPSPYFPKAPVLELIEGADFNKLHKKAVKLAPRFWGVDNNLLIPRPADLRNRLIPIQYILREAPNISGDSDLRFWAYDATTERIIKTAKQQQAKVFRHITDAPRPRKSGRQEKPTQPEVTFLDKFREQEIGEFVLKSLRADNDPVAETVASLENWLLESSTQPTKVHRSIGYTAFEAILFATRSDQIKSFMTRFPISNF